MTRQADISVVEPDDVQPTVDELLAEPVVPHDQLGTQTGDQHDRRIIAGTHGVVSKVHITDRRMLHIRDKVTGSA